MASTTVPCLLRSAIVTYSKTRRLLHFLVLGYIAVALILGWRFYHRELFPIFSWSLFSEVPSFKVDFGVRVTRVGDQVLEPPQDLLEMEDAVSSTVRIRAYYTIQDLGDAHLRRDLDRRESVRRLFEANYLKAFADPVAYQLVMRRYDPLDRWRGGNYEFAPLLELERAGDRP